MVDSVLKWRSLITNQRALLYFLSLGHLPFPLKSQVWFLFKSLPSRLSLFLPRRYFAVLHGTTRKGESVCLDEEELRPKRDIFYFFGKNTFLFRHLSLSFTPWSVLAQPLYPQVGDFVYYVFVHSVLNIRGWSSKVWNYKCKCWTCLYYKITQERLLPYSATWFVAHQDGSLIMKKIMDD